MLYLLVGLISFDIGICVGLLAAFSGLVDNTKLKPLDPMGGFKIYTRKEKK